ncbi:MAG: helix-turn-helix domain-containing protein [Solirubrobacterales bacterium]|nr:helix-turn-helix domain-containing protein [Solirubrobacterales bacterium]
MSQREQINDQAPTIGPDSDPRGDVLTAEQVAVILQVRPCTVADWARRGIIPSYKLGKFRRYSKKDISAWVSTRRSSSAERRPLN